MNDTKEKHATFTPGPWRLSCIDGVEDSLKVVGGDDGSDIVADIRTHENDILETRNSPQQMWVKKRLADLEMKEKEARANARLIAAAPDMYEMLKELENGIHLARARKGSKTIDKLREVLAKVDGGEG